MGMNLTRWAKRDDLKDGLRAILATPSMEAAIEVLETYGKPTTKIPGHSSDYMNNVALAHSFQAGIHFVLDKLKELPRVTSSSAPEEEKSWGRFGETEEESKKETQPQ